MNQPRPPVITIMGHVDHGKTSLLDHIRQARVAAGEAGGITQHIGAYTVEHGSKALTFIDTPGHAAFTKMRQRGAEVTDIIVLVVAANDGVKPQTIESIRHIKNSQAQVVVAINKIDLPDVYPDMVKAQLAEHGLLVTGYGGEIDTVEISAKTGQGIDQLLETLTVMAEVGQLEADPEAPLEAVVIEATKDPRRGSVASVIVKQGTLAVRQDIKTPEAAGRVRSLTDATGQQLDKVTPGWAAEIIGFKDVPTVGSIVHDTQAEYKSEPDTADEVGDQEVANDNPFAEVDFDVLFQDKPKLKIILRSDVEGTLEAIKQTLDEDSVELLDAGVGEVTDRDLELAETSGATILAFHLKTKSRIKKEAKARGIKLKNYDIIYELIEDLQKQMLKLMDSTIDEVELGQAEILQIFEIKGVKIAGVRVKTGELSVGDLAHIKRGDDTIANAQIHGMQHGKDEVTKVTSKSEAGITFKSKKVEFQVGDLVVAYKVEDE